MRKLLYLLLAVILLMFGLAYHASAQIVPAQNQQTTGPFGGIVLSTSTSPTAKLGQILGAAFGDILYWTGTRWQTAATSTLGITTPPGGLNLQVQYNNGGVFGGISGAVTNGTILNLTNPLLGGATLTTSVVNGVTLTTAGSATAYLNGSGTYTVPASSGITTLGPVGQGQTGSTQTLATSTSVYQGLTSAITIVGSGNTQTFTPSLAGILAIAGGGTGSSDASNGFANLSPIASKGDLITTTGAANPSALAVGANETFLQASSTASKGLIYSKISLSRSVLDILGVANGGTGSSTLGGLLSGNGTSVSSSPTTTVSCTGSTTCSAFTVIGSSPVTINTTAGGAGTVTNIATTYPITGGPITTTGTLALAFGTTTSNTWAGTQTFTNSPIFSTVGAGIVNATAAGTIYNTATSSLAVSSPLTVTGTLGALIGGTNSTINCQTASGSQAGCLSSTDFNTFNNKQSGGFQISTTSPISQGNLAYFTGVTPTSIGGVATGTVANGTGISVTAGQSVIGSGLTITNTGVTSNVAGAGISVSGATGAVTITNTIGYPFPSNATTTVLTFTNGLTAGNTITFSGITGTANNCLQANATGVVSGTGSACGTGSGGANSKWASTTLPSNGITPNGGNNTAVGVGTSTPIGAQLVTSSSTAPQLGLTDGGSVGFGFRNAGGKLYIATTTGAGATTTMSSVFAINGTGAMVGIAADVPTDTTFFNFFIRDQNLAGPAITLGGNNGGDNSWILRRFANNDGLANDRLSFGTGDQNAAMAEIMTLLPNGNVGVGTTTPQWVLQSASSTAAQLALTYNSTSPHWTVNNIAGNLFFATSSPTTFATSTFAGSPLQGFIEFPSDGGCIGCSDISLIGGINLRSAQYVTATSSNLTASVMQDIYTAPSGRRVYVEGANFNQPTGASTQYSTYLKSGGAYYHLVATTTSSAAAGHVVGIILEPGESISLLASASGASAWYQMISFSSDTPFYSPKTLTPTAGTSTLYTVPAGRSASMVGQNPLIPSIAGATFYNNTNGPSPTTQFNVRSGDIPNNFNKVGAGNGTAATANGMFYVNTAVMDVMLNSGGSLAYLLSSTVAGGSIIWANVYEH